MSLEPNQETWEIEANGQIFTAGFDELETWISEGSLLKIDRVRKGNLRWIEAGKVPALTKSFNTKDESEPSTPIVTTTNTEVLGVAPQTNTFVNADAPPIGSIAPTAEVCSMHPEAPAAYACDTCSNLFCKACPTGYGASVKICPFCGALCRSLAESVVSASMREHRVNAEMSEGFGFGDLGRALAHPFKFKVSLVVGAIMFMFFSLGQAAGGFGGIFMLAAVIICFMLSNMLTFGILANTIENFAQGKTDENFMPSFDDFNIWDDVVHPFFLSIGVYLSSFGPFLVVVAVAFFLMVGSVGNQMSTPKATVAGVVDPALPFAANAASQSEQVRLLTNRAVDAQKRRVEALQSGQTAPPPAANTNADEDYDNLQKMIQDQKRVQLESTIGKAPETKAKEQQEMFKRILGMGALLLIFGGITLLWGIFYFPAACAVAGYTRSFMATMNPSVGLDTIRRFGSSYVLILVMSFLLSVASGMITGAFNAAFSAFDMPTVGNIPARALSSLTGFYIWVVFSCILGYALFKASDRLKLHR